MVSSRGFSGPGLRKGDSYKLTRQDTVYEQINEDTYDGGEGAVGNGITALYSGYAGTQWIMTHRFTNLGLNSWGLLWLYNDKTGQATIRMNRRAVLKRWWTSQQDETFTVLSTASLFSSIEASSVLFLSPFYKQKMPKYVLNLYVT